MSSLRKNLLILIVMNGSLLLFAVAYVIYFNLSSGTSFAVRCFIKDNFGIYCPGCGGSRALTAFLKFRFLKSFILYPPITVGALVILDYDIRLLITLIKRDTKITDNFKFYTFILIPVAIIASFAVKNILLFGFGIDTVGDFSL